MSSAEGGFDGNMALLQASWAKGARGGGGGDPVANEKDMMEYLFDTVGSASAGLGSMMTGIPNKTDVFSTGIQKQFEMPEGMHEKMINPFAQSFSTQGGFLYRMFASLIKNGEITSHVEGIEPLEMGGADFGEGGSYGDGGGGGDSGGDYGSGGNYGESSLADFGGGNPFAGEGANVESLFVDYGGHRYEVSSMSESVLGNITPSAGGDAGSISKGDIELG